MTVTSHSAGDGRGWSAAEERQAHFIKVLTGDLPHGTQALEQKPARREGSLGKRGSEGGGDSDHSGPEAGAP